jgi:hypothetical protein
MYTDDDISKAIEIIAKNSNIDMYTYQGLNSQIRDLVKLKSLEINLKLNEVYDRSELREAIKIYKSVYGEDKLVQVIDKLNIDKFKDGLKIINKLYREYTRDKSSDCCKIDKNAFSPVLSILDIDNIHDIVTYIAEDDLYKSYGCFEDIIAVRYVDGKFRLEHLYINKNRQIEEIYNSVDIEDESLLEIRAFKFHVDSFVENY